MTTYAKMNQNGTLEALRGLPNVSNPTEKTIAAYAEAHGYKRVEEADRPGEYYDSTYTDTGETIVRVWVPWDIDRAKASATQRVQEWRDSSIGSTASVPCALGWNVEYTPSTMTIANGVVTMMMAGLAETTSWTDADNVRHDGLTFDAMKAIVAAIAGHVQIIQDRSDAAKAAIVAASTNADVEAAIRNL